MTSIQHDEAALLAVLFVGHKIVKVTKYDDGRPRDLAGSLELDDGTVIEIEPNQGCGGCGEGWYQITELNGCDNVITSVDVTEDSEHIRLFVFAENQQINLITAEGHDNGYYGTGFQVHVRS